MLTFTRRWFHLLDEDVYVCYLFLFLAEFYLYRVFIVYLLIVCCVQKLYIVWSNWLCNFTVYPDIIGNIELIIVSSKILNQLMEF